MCRSFGGLLSVIVVGVISVASGGRVVFVELPGTVGTVEFMAFAGHSSKGNSHQQQGE